MKAPRPHGLRLCSPACVAFFEFLAVVRIATKPAGSRVPLVWQANASFSGGILRRMQWWLGGPLQSPPRHSHSTAEESIALSNVQGQREPLPLIPKHSRKYGMPGFNSPALIAVYIFPSHPTGTIWIKCPQTLTCLLFRSPSFMTCGRSVLLKGKEAPQHHEIHCMAVYNYPYMKMQGKIIIATFQD
jgi:hypothetical protein